jgi:hypothetical protein
MLHRLLRQTRAATEALTQARQSIPMPYRYLNLHCDPFPQFSSDCYVSTMPSIHANRVSPLCRGRGGQRWRPERDSERFSLGYR